MSGTAGKVLKRPFLAVQQFALQAFLASTGEHTLVIHGSSRRILLQHVRWELLDDQGQPEPAGGTTAGAAAPAATSQPSTGSSAQQHKRKQTLPNTRSTRARLQAPDQPQQATPLSAASDAAGAPAAAGDAGEGGNGSRSRAQPRVSSQAGAAAKPSTRASKAAAEAGQGTCSSSPKRPRRAGVSVPRGSGAEDEPSQGLSEEEAAAGPHAGPTLAPAAAAAEGAPPGPVQRRPQRRIQPTMVQSSPAAAFNAATTTRQHEDVQAQADKQDVAKSVAGTQPQPILQADVDAEAVVKRAADRAVKPSSAEEAVGAGQARPQRNRQPSKRLVLPGEEQHDTHSMHQQQQTAAGNSMLRDAARPAKAPAVQPGPSEPGWPTDQQLRQAVAAQQVPCIAAGKGEVRWQLPNGTDRTLEVQLEDFVLGNPLSCHTASQPGPVDAPKLFQQVGGLHHSINAGFGVE